MGGNMQKMDRRWRIDYRDPQGRRHRETFDTRKEADDALDEVLNPDEIRKLLEKAEPGFYRTLFVTAYVTGMRSGQLFALRWSDIELKAIDSETGQESSRGKIYVRRSLSWARVKGEEGLVRPRFYPPKTKAGIRTLSIPVELAGALRRWKLQSPQNVGGFADVRGRRQSQNRWGRLGRFRWENRGSACFRRKGTRCDIDLWTRRDHRSGPLPAQTRHLKLSQHLELNALDL